MMDLENSCLPLTHEEFINERTPLQNERKLRRQAKNKLKKEDVKRVREEELRRKFFEPKDQRVRLVDQKELDISVKRAQYDSGSTSRFVTTSEEFPSLEEVKSKDKRQKMLITPVAYEETTSPKPKPHSTRPSSSNEVVPIPLKLDMLQTPVNVTSKPISQQSKKASVIGKDLTKNQNSKPKRNDPIHIDVLTALKKSETASVPDKRVAPKKESPPRLTGKQLDSSNPERKKGKVREIPKEKKPTHLKRVIVKERAEKKLAQQKAKSSADVKTNETNSSLGTSKSIDSVSHLDFREDHTDVTAEILMVNDQSEDLVSGFPLPITLDDTPNLKEKCVKQIRCPSVVRPTERNMDLAGQREDRIIDEMQDTSCFVKNSDMNDSFENTARMSLHNRKFREYCDHTLSPELDTVVSALVRDIVNFQDRLYFSNPIKAHAKRRFVLGFREVKKYLSFKKIKLMIIAPDLERVKSKDGIDDIIGTLKLEASAQEVPYVFAVGRKGLKKLTNKSHNVLGISCIGILSYEGSEDNFHTVQSILPSLRAQYAEKFEIAKHSLRQKFEIGSTEASSVAILAEETTTEEKLIDINTEVVASFLSKLVKELGKDWTENG